LAGSQKKDNEQPVYYDNESEAIAEAEAKANELRDYYRDIIRNPEPSEDSQKYKGYQVPGGENYRELLLTLPNPKALPAGYEVRQMNTGRWGVFGPGPLSENRYSSGDTKEEALKAFDQHGHSAYKSPHWNEGNVLMPIRFNEREDTNGARTLFIEEIQSDWHQEGRKKGYKKPEMQSRIKELEAQSREIEAKGREATQEEKQRWADLKNEHQSLIRTMTHAAPNAPLKQTDRWAMLGMKRMIQWAAENGFDKIAWTPGEEQAKRYDLSKQIESIRWTKKPDGYRIDAFKDGRAIITKENLSDAALEEHVGKEIAQKIIKGEGAFAGSNYDTEMWGEGNVGLLKNIDLRIGGDGMKSFYDGILKNETEKYIKKFGSKVGQTEIFPAGETDFYRGENLKVPAFDITPEMRSAVKAKGQPLYSKSENRNDPADPFDPDPEPMPPLAETAKTQAEKVTDALKKIAGGFMGDTRSQADRKRPDFERAQRLNPDAGTDFELEHNNKNARAVKARKAEDSLILGHLDADKNVITGMIRKITGPGDLQDWLLKKAARVLAPFQAAKPIERMLFTVAENMAYDEQNDTLKPSPGIRRYNRDTGEYEYIPGQHAAAAEHFFNTLAPNWKRLMTDRAKENEDYRKHFVDVVVPHAKAQTAIALLARYKQLGAASSAIQGSESEARSMLQKINSKIDPAEYKELESLLDKILKIPADMIGKNTVALEGIIKTAKGELKSPAALQAELKRLRTNRGHYGYVHHYFESDNIPSQGKAFDAFGRIPNGWIEETPGTQKLRTGAEGNTRNLLKADIAKNTKEIRAEASNAWMQQVEDQRGLLVEDWEDIPDMPGGYDECKKVVANFGKFRGKEIYLPDRVYGFYKQVREVGLEDPGMKEFGDAVQMIDGVTNRMNEAMLYHPGKFARDLMAAPFHMVEFLRDWSTKNPGEAVLAIKALAKATAGAAKPSTWQKYTPESEGEYSESLAYQDKDGKKSFLTRATDSIGAWFTNSVPVGSTLASFLKELNLSGAADLPMKRIMRSVGEQIADSRQLSGKERERFIYDVVNDYAFNTQDLPAALAYLRGQRPTKGSRAWGAVMRTTIPFLGYSSRLAKQMLADPISKGAFPMAKRLVGMKEQDARFLDELSETSRPFVWLFLKSLVAAGLGGLIPKEKEGLASEIQEAKNLDPLARTHGRILVGQDDGPEGGERWLSTKGLSHLQVADAVSKVIDGKSSVKDFSAEFLTIHPTMQLLLGMAGVSSAYQADVPMTAQLGRSVAQAMIPQATRLGPDMAKFFRAVAGNNTVPDAKKQTFFTGFFEQLGVPVGAVKVDRDGKLRITKPGLEALKMFGINLREIPYDMVLEAAEGEAKSLDHLVKRIKMIQEYTDGDRDQDLSEREFIAKTLKTNRFATLDEAMKDAENELRARGKGVLATVAKLREKGIQITEKKSERNPLDDKFDLGKKLERKFQRAMPGQANTVEQLIRDVGSNSRSKDPETAIGELERLINNL